VADDAARDQAMKLVSSLRREGFAVETDPRGGSLKSQMKRADRTQARYTLVLGGNEVSSGEAQLKPMAGGEPVPVKLDALAAELRRRTEVR
jgi:histidyl-tRNA synthetase